MHFCPLSSASGLYQRIDGSKGAGRRSNWPGNKASGQANEKNSTYQLRPILIEEVVPPNVAGNSDAQHRHHPTVPPVYLHFLRPSEVPDRQLDPGLVAGQRLLQSDVEEQRVGPGGVGGLVQASSVDEQSGKGGSAEIVAVLGELEAERVIVYSAHRQGLLAANTAIPTRQADVAGERHIFREGGANVHRVDGAILAGYRFS